MSQNPPDRILPEAGETLPLAESVQKARAALAQAIVHLEEFQADARYPSVTRTEANGVISAIRSADKRAAELDPPFVMKD